MNNWEDQRQQHGHVVIDIMEDPRRVENVGWSGPQVHRFKGPDRRGTTVGLGVLAEPDLHNSVGEVALDVLDTTSFGATTKTHSLSASLASRGDDTSHVKFGSFESSSTFTPSSGQRLFTAKANASLVDTRYGSKDDYVRGQAFGVEANVKLDKGAWVPRVSVRPYWGAVEVAKGVASGPQNLPYFSDPVEVSGSGKVRLTVGTDLVGTPKPRLMTPIGDIKPKVSGSLSVGWSPPAPRDIETGHGGLLPHQHGS